MSARTQPAAKTSCNASPRRAATLLAALLLVALPGCSDPEPTAEENRLLVIDGITITFDDLAPYVEFLHSYMPESGIKTRNLSALSEHVLPVAFARREFPEQRAEMLELARGLCDVAQNVNQLDEMTSLMEHRRRSNLTRITAKLPVAKFLFEPLNVGRVSPPLEMPHGWFVVAAYDLFESQLVMSDYVDALQVGFITHTSLEWRNWWDAQKPVIGERVTFVHPDYRDDLPKWMKAPEKP